MTRIESGIPLPDRSGGPGRPPRYPWANMKIGDSFESATITRAAASIASKRYGMKFATRTMPNGNLRVWRVKK